MTSLLNVSINDASGIMQLDEAAGVVDESGLATTGALIGHLKTGSCNGDQCLFGTRICAARDDWTDAITRGRGESALVTQLHDMIARSCRANRDDAGRRSYPYRE